MAIPAAHIPIKKQPPRESNPINVREVHVHNGDSTHLALLVFVLAFLVLVAFALLTFAFAFALLVAFDDKTENRSTDDESGDGQSTKSEDDMDSGVTFDEDSDKDIDTVEIEEEDWIDYIRRSTADAIDKMEHAKIRCWNKTHRKMKWKLALRTATSPSERWIKKLLNGTLS